MRIAEVLGIAAVGLGAWWLFSQNTGVQASTGGQTGSPNGTAGNVPVFFKSGAHPTKSSASLQSATVVNGDGNTLGTSAVMTTTSGGLIYVGQGNVPAVISPAGTQKVTNAPVVQGQAKGQVLNVITASDVATTNQQLNNLNSTGALSAGFLALAKARGFTV